MTGGARRDRGPPLLARGHPWGAELAHRLGRPWVGIQDEGAQRSGPASPQVAVVQFPGRGAYRKISGRVRASKPNARCWVQRTSLGAQRPAQAMG